MSFFRKKYFKKSKIFTFYLKSEISMEIIYIFFKYYLIFLFQAVYYL